MECQIIVDRGKGFTFCQFSQIIGSDKDTTKVKPLSTNFQGRVIESEQVTAISIAFSEFDHIPSSVFSNFGNVMRMKFYGGKISYVKKESFTTATHLRFLEIQDTKINEITSNAFEGAKELEELTLENCKIGKIADDAFVGLTKLKKLKLTGSSYPNGDFLNKLPETVKTIDKP